MKYLLLSILITSILTFCNSNRNDEKKYDIYSSVLENQFGHIPQKASFIVGVNDTIEDFRDELGTLIFSVENNNDFFKEYCKGDSAFKDFILAIKTIKTDKENMNIDRLKAKTKIRINLNKLIKSEPWHLTINLSKIVFNDNNDRAILFVVGSSTGSWFFVQLVNKKWIVKHQIVSWVT